MSQQINSHQTEFPDIFFMNQTIGEVSSRHFTVEPSKGTGLLPQGVSSLGPIFSLSLATFGADTSQGMNNILTRL